VRNFEEIVMSIEAHCLPIPRSRPYGFDGVRFGPVAALILGLAQYFESVGVAGAAEKTMPLPCVKEFSLVDAKGGRHTPAEWQKHKAVVMVFLGTECPVSNSYCPTISRLVKSYQSKGVVFYAVHPDPDVGAAEAIKHAAEYKLPDIALLLDPRQILASKTGVTLVPEAVVLASNGQVLYRGRIDDRYSLDGKRRIEPSTKDLADAIEAALAGKSPDPAVVKAFGCPLPPPAKQ
jgi:thiol-disulfide isomerase/thioredoxin